MIVLWSHIVARKKPFGSNWIMMINIRTISDVFIARFTTSFEWNRSVIRIPVFYSDLIEIIFFHIKVNYSVEMTCQYHKKNVPLSTFTFANIIKNLIAKCLKDNNPGLLCALK